MEPLCSSRFMLELECLDVEVRHLFDRVDFETIDNLSYFEVVRLSVFTAGNIVSKLVSLASGFHHFSASCFLLLHFH